MNKATPLTIAADLKEALLRYVNSNYRLRSPGLREERLELLSADGRIFAEPLVEPVLPYPLTDDLGEVASAAGYSAETARVVGDALFRQFGAERPGIRRHQAEAISWNAGSAGRPSKHVVVTSGTGSGKTEAFLLPILLRLVEEARTWEKQPLPVPWWEGADVKTWTPLRSGEARPAALRALILYPTNALVEDQLSRLRQAFRRIEQSLPQARLWFGRYTSATIGRNRIPSSGDASVKAAATEIRSLAHEFRQLADSGKASEADLALFADPTNHEMVCRWDIVQSPPDILISNFAMLNAVLMRDFESDIFARTRSWLDESAENTFTLVVDELHSYRGAAGSETALLIRRLLDRLGLGDGSPQLRIIAASASLNDSKEGREYLEEFFPFLERALGYRQVNRVRSVQLCLWTADRLSIQLRRSPCPPVNSRRL